MKKKESKCKERKREKCNVWKEKDIKEMYGRKKNVRKDKERKCMKGKSKKGNVWKGKKCKERERK